MPVFHQKMLCRFDQSGLLGIRNTLGRASEIHVFPFADFDKDKLISILHDQIDLAETAPVIPLKKI